MFELNQLRCFVAVAAELHFGRAARRLHMTQPPLSRQIQLLERELDVQLFERTSRSVRLTAAGRAFLAEARQILQQSETAKQVARRAANNLSGSVMVGFIGAASYHYLPLLVTKARLELPTIDITYTEMMSRLQIDELAVGKLDIGLMRGAPVDANARSICVRRETLMLALPLQHPLSARRRVSLDQIRGEPYIMYSPGDGRYMYDMLDQMFKRHAIQPQVIQHLSHTLAILSLVSAGLGIALVPESARNACFDNVVLRQIHLGPKLLVELHAVWRHDNLNAAMGPLRDLIIRNSMTENTGFI
jgi:DNA-binding transcriptional LysR family regulator